MTTAISIRGRVTRIPSEADQRAERVAELAAKYAAGVDRDKAERAERMAKRNATLSPAQVSARRLAAVTEELERNGIEVPRESTGEFPQSTCREPREMSREDIANVAPLTPSDEAKVLSRLGKLPSQVIKNRDGVEFTLYDWAEDDCRWGMTPHQLRKYEESLV